MSNQIVISSGAKVRNLNGVLTGTSGIVNSLGINVPDGIPQLDGSGKILVSQLPNSVMEYKGTWNAATNTPTLANGTGNAGDVYLCEVAGTVDFGAGPITFAVGDQVLYSGTTWQRASGATGTVTSVAVTESGDALTITGSPITTSGTINIGFAGTGSQYIKGDGTLATFPTTIEQAKKLITEVYNSTGATLTKGTVVYINGGQGNLPTITKAIATGDSTSAQTYGVVQSDITNNNNGFVVVVGSLGDLDTQAYTVGTQLYLSGTTAGAWTSTKPSAPIHLVYVAIVVRSHPTQGVVEVRIQNGYELDELHDVAISSPVNNQGIFYNSSNDLWENKTIDEALGYTPANDSLVVHLAGTETITGAKTFSSAVSITTASYLTSRLKMTNTATGGNIWTISSGNANNSTNNGLFTIINETLSKNTFVLSPTGKLAIGGDIGTTNPADDLGIFSTNPNLKIFDISGNGSNLNLQTTNTSAFISAAYITTAIPLVLRTGNTDRLTIAANGDSTFANNLTAASFIKSGGTSSQFLMADGSVNTSVLPSGAYLPLSGGTLTGALSGTSATFTSGIFNNGTNSTNGIKVVSSLSGSLFTGGIEFIRTTVVGGSKIEPFRDATSGGVGFNFLTTLNNAAEVSGTYTTALSIASTGAATFSSSVTAGGNFLVPAGSGLVWSGDSSRIMTPEDNVSGALIQTPGIIRFNAGGSEKMRITSSGNVGIGTSSPSEKLDVIGGAVAAGNGTIRTGITYSSLGLIGTFTNHDLGVITNGSERMRITSSGQVLINTSSDSYGDGSALVTQANKGATIQTTAGGGYCALVLRRTASDGGLTEHYYGTTYVGGINISTTSTSYATSSDYRLKEDLKEINGLEKVSAIKVYDFKWKASNERNDGVLAHELAEVLPYAVNGEKDGEQMQGVDYSKIVPVLVKAIQELNEKIKQLENK